MDQPIHRKPFSGTHTKHAASHQWIHRHQLFGIANNQSRLAGTKLNQSLDRPRRAVHGKGFQSPAEWKQKQEDNAFGWSETALSVKPGPVAKPSLGIYPNPSVNELKLDFTKIDHRKNWTISVIDTQGRVIQQQIIYPHQTFIKLDVSQLKPGSYLVSANELGGETKLSERFVKE